MILHEMSYNYKVSALHSDSLHLKGRSDVFPASNCIVSEENKNASTWEGLN